LRIPHDRLFKELLGTFLYEFLELFLPELAQRELNRMNWRDYARKPSPVAAALMSRMGIEPQERPVAKLACLRLLGKLNLPGPQSRLIGQFFDSYLQLNPEEEKRYRHEFDKISPEEKSAMLELTTSWHEKGREEGREEIALRLLAMGLTVEQIQQATELSKERIYSLKESSERSSLPSKEGSSDSDFASAVE
jgi:hypothetical protein